MTDDQAHITAPAVGGGLCASGIDVRYQGTPQPALTGVSVTVPPGTALVVTGPAGCGRTSLVRAMTGLVAPTAGTVTVLDGNPLDPAVRRRVGFGPEGTPFPKVMRVCEALRLVAAIRGVDPALIPDTMSRVGLRSGAAATIRSLQVEDVRRLSLACAVLGDPEALVLDDPWQFEETEQLLLQSLARGATVLVATPDPGGFPALLGAPVVTLDEGVVV